MPILVLFALLPALAGCGLLRSAPAPEQTPGNVSVVREVAGVLAGETVLSGEVLLTGDVLVPRGSTLVIKPGTLVRIRPSESTKIDPEYLSSSTEILVRGRLLAEGTASAPIAFLPETPGSAGEVSWAGIILDRPAFCRLYIQLIPSIHEDWARLYVR